MTTAIVLPLAAFLLYDPAGMASRASQIDFRRYGKYLMVLGLLFGMFLTRHLGSCLKDYWDRYDISSGVKDAKDSTGLVDDSGAVKKGTEGDYEQEVLAGASFPRYVVYVCKKCTADSSFSDPFWAFITFWSLLGLGLLLIILDRFISPGWREDVRKRNQEIESIKRSREDTDLRVRRAQTTTGSLRKVEAIDVGGVGSDPDLGAGRVVSNSGDLPTIPRPSPRPVLGEDEDDLADFGHAEFAIEHNAADDSADEPALPTGDKVPARADLASLGLGPVSDDVWLSGNDADGGHAAFSIDAAESDSYDSLPTGVTPSGELDSDNEFPNFDGNDSALGLLAAPSLGGAGEAPAPMSVQPDEEVRSYDDDPPSIAEARAPLGREGAAGAATSGVRLSQRRQGKGPVRPARPLPGARTEDPSSADDWMDPPSGASDVLLHAAAGVPASLDSAEAPPGRPKRAVSTVGSSSTIRQRFGAWVPQGRENDRVVYACPEGEGAAGGGDSPEHPVGGIGNAIKTATRLIAEGHGSHVRLLPGLYRETVVVPAGVALVNDGIPRGLERDELRFWLLGSAADDDRSHHVVIAPPPGRAQVSTVVISRAREAILAGVHVVSRAEIDGQGDDAGPSRGVEVVDSPGVSLYLCHIAGHRTAERGAGLYVKNAGATADDRLLIQDCLIEANRSQGPGGGIFLEDTVTIVRGSAVQANESAHKGGGVCIVGNPDRPILFEDSIITDNVVHVPSGLPRASRTGWSGDIGHGGGMFLDGGSLHIKGTDVLENLAQGAGGGIFASCARILIEGNPDAVELTGRVAGNRALRGGGILLSGGKSGSDVTALKTQNAEFIGNEAKESGGAIAAFRLAYVELHDTLVKQNTASGEYGEGGGIHVTLGCRAKLFTTEVCENEALFRGGGISACNSSLRIFDACEVHDNRCSDGDTGGIAFYTMQSSYLEDVREHKEFEDPVVFELGEVDVTRNHAARGIGGLFVGNYVKDATQAITFATRAPERIAGNTVSGPDGNPARSGDLGPKKPVDILVLWKRTARGNERKPPTGKKVLR